MSRLKFEYDPTHSNIFIKNEATYCNGAIQESNTEEEIKVNIKQPLGLVKPTKSITTITDEIVNTCIKENPDIVTNYLTNERTMKTQRKQMNARSLLKNAFKK